MVILICYLHKYFLKIQHMGRYFNDNVPTYNLRVYNRERKFTVLLKIIFIFSLLTTIAITRAETKTFFSYIYKT